MTTVRLLVFSLVLSGCVHAPEGTRSLIGPERNLIETVMATWSAHENLEPVSETCTEGLERFGLNIVDTDAEMFELTGYCGPTVNDRASCQERMADGECRNGCAWSVYRSYVDGVWPFVFFENDRAPMIVVWDMPDLTAGLIHESLHWLEDCTGRGIDYVHADHVLWGPDGLLRRLR